MNETAQSILFKRKSLKMYIQATYLGFKGCYQINQNDVQIPVLTDCVN